MRSIKLIGYIKMDKLYENFLKVLCW